jgi:tetrahydromethanopterin S-methyltransferase subunit G
MRIFFLLLLFLPLILLVSCNHSIWRSNYQPNKGEFSKCQVVFIKTVQAGDTFVKVGEVELKDSNYSIHCNEAHALELLEKEACALNANVVKVVNEKRPNIGSSCYRCKAEIYKLKQPVAELKSDAYYTNEELEKRIKKDKNRNAGLLFSSVIVGFAIAILLFTL